MKHEKLSNALNEISDPHIAEAAAPKKKVRPTWLGAVAAVLAVTVLTGVLWNAYAPSGDHAPPPTGGLLVAAPVYPDMADYSEENWDAWREDQLAQYGQPDGYANGTEDFFRASIRQLLTSETENQACSPVNIYLALAMLAETADGSSRQQVLDLLGADTMKALRTQAGYVWNAHYCDDGLSASVLANSLWLDSNLSYNEDTVRTLAEGYYASVYRGDLGSNAVNEALRAWINSQTKDLLKEQAQGIKLDDDAMLALASTIYYNVQWSQEFCEDNNYNGTFHTPGGDTSATYMYQNQASDYFWGEDFGAVSLYLRDGSHMWLILPEEGYTPVDLLESGHALDMVLSDTSDYENQRYAWVKLSVPKFDIASETDLIPALQALGVTDLFDPDTADLSAIIPTSDDTPYVSQAEHAARVSIDEKGVTAAAYTVILTDASAADVEDEIEFTLDRPFLFIIESRDNIPIFSGIVNEP